MECTTGAALDTVPELFVDFAVTFNLNADFNGAFVLFAELFIRVGCFLELVLDAADEVFTEEFFGLETELERSLTWLFFLLLLF